MDVRVPSSTSLTSAGEGHAEQWATVWAEHRGALLRYARHLLHGDTHAAEDIVQEVAIRLWQHREVLDGEPLAGWLRTVVRNLVIDRARRGRVRPHEVELAPGFDVAGHAGGPDAADATELGAALGAAVSALPSGHRAAVWEVHVQERPVVEVAVELGIPAGTVKSRCHTARRRLASALECA